MTFGTVTNFDASATVRFERIIDAAIDRVWRALTDVEELGGWLAHTEMELRRGGPVSIDFGEGGHVTGEVLVADGPNTLEYTWNFADESKSVVRFELAAQGAQTRLVLEHRLLPPDQAVGYGAGWHAHLDMLTAQITGGAPVDWDERFAEVLGGYTGV